MQGNNSIRLKLMDFLTDVDDVYSLMSSEDQYLFSTIILVRTKNEFIEWLQDRLYADFHDFRVIMYQNEVIGVAYNYEFRITHGHCKLCVVIKEKFRNSGIGALAAVSYLRYLFETYPLRKVYSTVYGYNRQSLLSNHKAGFTLEGELKDYKYYNGAYYSLYFYSISREYFFSKLARFADNG